MFKYCTPYQKYISICSSSCLESEREERMNMVDDTLKIIWEM